MRAKIGRTDIVTKNELTSDNTLVSSPEIQGYGFVSNIQWGILVRYADGVVDLYVYQNKQDFDHHASQFKDSPYVVAILWSCDGSHKLS